MAEIIDMASQFKGLPMADLIGGPLTAACDAQVKLANATANFIKYIGFMPPSDSDKDGVGATRLAHFAFTRPVVDPKDSSKTVEESVSIDVPLLAIVKIPSLSITKVDITFDMEVKSSFSAKETQDTKASFAADAKFGWGPLSVSVHLEGSVASHKENPLLGQFGQVPRAGAGRGRRHAGGPGARTRHPADLDPAARRAGAARRGLMPT